MSVEKHSGYQKVLSSRFLSGRSNPSAQRYVQRIATGIGSSVVFATLSTTAHPTQVAAMISRMASFFTNVLRSTVKEVVWTYQQRSPQQQQKPILRTLSTNGGWRRHIVTLE